MPVPRPSRLSLLTFPQRWQAGTVKVRFLCLPEGDPEQPPAAGLPSFSTANLVFAARLIGSLDQLPRAVYAPKTELWAVLYARVRQTDGASWRNLVLTRKELPPAGIFNAAPEGNAAVLFGEGEIEKTSVPELLRRVGLPEDAPLTTLAVELFRNSSDVDPAPDRASPRSCESPRRFRCQTLVDSQGIAVSALQENLRFIL